ncbi:MAG: hypothetical protein IPL77_07250 [Flavobacteriales bacterium]|nr:hypothetical protein [Flavobacteriales bacterium]
MKKQILLLSALVCVAGIAWGQEELSAAQYEQLKAAGQLPAHYTVDLSAPPKQAVKGQPRPGQPKEAVPACSAIAGSNRTLPTSWP